jgi:hypothetical protein
MTERVSKVKILLARLVLVLMVAFIIIGVAMHGLSVSMAFRIVLQPIMASIAALIDGIKDARTGRNPYLWTILSNPLKRSSRLHEGLISTARIILLGLGMDLIYQYLVFDTFHPAEAVIIAGVLCFLPYLLLRGPITRIARRWLDRRSADKFR